MNFDHPQVQSLLLQMGLQPEELRAIGKAKNRGEAVQRLEALKAKFKKCFKKMVLQLHPDRNDGDSEKTAQFQLLMEMSKEFENLKINDPPTAPTVRYQTMFNGPIPPIPPKRPGVPHYYPETNTMRTCPNPPSVVFLKPTGVTSPRTR